MGTWLLFWKIGAIVSIAATIFANRGMWIFALMCIGMIWAINKSKKNGKEEC